MIGEVMVEGWQPLAGSATDFGAAALFGGETDRTDWHERDDN
jgi:hypothetical protein